MLLAIVALATFALSLLGVALTAVFTSTARFVAVPRADRWHTRPVALFGGVGIFVAFLAGVALLFANVGFPATAFAPAAFFLGAAVLFTLGLADDVRSLKPSTKLAGQIVAVSVPIVAGIVFQATPWLPVNILVTFLWFIVIINAINILDNMDGLAAGIVMIATATFIAIRFVSAGGTPMADPAFPIAIIFLASVAGFWLFNRHPARIFMGDTGSLVLGYVLAALVLPSAFNGFLGTSSVLLALLIPATIVAVPLFDTALVTVSRMLHGRSVAQGGKDHSSHRLVCLGLSERGAVRTLYAFAVIGGIVAVLLAFRPAFSTGFLLLYGVTLALIGTYLGAVKVYARATDAPAPRPHRAHTLLHKRQIVEVLLDFALIVMSYAFAYILRYEAQFEDVVTPFATSLPIVVAACMVGFFLAGVYRGLWHLITIADLGRFAVGVASGVGISALALTFLYRFAGYSRSVFLIFGILLFLFTVGARLSFRFLDAYVRRRTNASRATHVLIYGAGQAGRLLVDECNRNPQYAAYRIAGFVDDDADKQRHVLGGVPIAGADDAVAAHAAAPIHELWVSSDRIPPAHAEALAARLAGPGQLRVRIRRFTVAMMEEAGSAPRGARALPSQ